jgi:hypothetical protein
MQSSSNKLFVAVPPKSLNGLIIFGVNSIRPVDEVQEVVYFPASDCLPESSVKVSFIKTNYCTVVGSIKVFFS